MEKLKILSKIKFGNNDYCYALNRKVCFKYTKADSETIIGNDEGLYKFFKKAPYSKHWKAFGGNEFTIKLTDGSEERCYGQWWHGLSKKALEMHHDKKFIPFTFSSIEELKNCYVFRGCLIDEAFLRQLEEEFVTNNPNYKIYEYYEFEKEINKGCK